MSSSPSGKESDIESQLRGLSLSSQAATRSTNTRAGYDTAHHPDTEPETHDTQMTDRYESDATTGSQNGSASDFWANPGAGVHWHDPFGGANTNLQADSIAGSGNQSSHAGDVTVRKYQPSKTPYTHHGASTNSGVKKSDPPSSKGRRGGISHSRSAKKDMFEEKTLRDLLGQGNED
ncbi:hypothetical protein IAU59_006326 [Kwoniella sp. CBS 9459]